MSGICLSLALLHLAVFFRRTERKVDLFFAIVALSIAVSTFYQTLMLRAVTVSAFATAFKSAIFFQGVMWATFAWFVAAYTGVTRRRLVLAVTGLYALAVIINAILPNGIIYNEINGLYHITLPWGERLTYASGSTNWWRLIADFGWLMLLYLCAESCVRLGRAGQTRRAYLFGGVLLVFIGAAYLHGTLIDMGVVGPPELTNFAFLGLVLVMSASLVSEISLASKLSMQVEEGERRYRFLLDNSLLLAIVVSDQGLIKFVNKTFTEMTGFSAQEVLGKPFQDLFPEREQQDLQERFARAMQGELRPSVIRPIITKDGAGERQIKWVNVIVRNGKNENREILSIGEDITDLKETEMALVDEKARMDTILSALDTGLALINPDLTVAWVNEKTLGILPWDELVGKVCYEAAAKRDEPCEGCGALQAFVDGQVHETQRQSPVDGKWHYIVSVPIKDKQGNVINVLESVTDITNRKQAEIARDQAIKEVEALKIRLEEENIYLKTQVSEKALFSDIIGKSNALVYVLNRVDEVAQTGTTVLVQGETGTGKELIARAIHDRSNRSAKPFIKVNCAALPSNLVESELFGHERGAYTGAENLRKGRFELADGGTLLLDEVSEMPLETQAKLLRVLQDSTFERVGGSQTIKVDVRVIAASNRDLNAEIVAGRFRSDLFYRLNVYPLTIPPLRKRREDIPLLAEHFIPMIASRIGKHIDQVPVQVMEELTTYNWPGNVRELKNVIERAIITATKSVLLLPSKLAQPANSEPEKSDSTPKLTTLDEAQRQHILDVLKATNWRINGPKGAAAILGINPSTLRSRIKKLEIKKP